MFGDPVEGRFVVLRTVDGGASWLRVPAEGMPRANAKEAAFAASGTCVAVEGDDLAWFATGGEQGARVFRTSDGGETWSAVETPLRHDAASAGIFSIAFADARRGVAVGGDFRKPEEAVDNAAVTADGGLSWRAVQGAGPRGFRSGAAWGPDGRVVVAVGTSGSDWSVDGGESWMPLGDVGYNAVRFSPGGAAWAVGPEGRIAKLVPPVRR